MKKPNEMLWIIGIICLLAASLIAKFFSGWIWVLAVLLMTFAVICGVTYAVQTIRWNPNREK